MLTKVIKRFFKEKNVDEQFSAKIDEAQTISDFAEIVAEPGLELSKEEFNGVLADILKDELSEGDLDQVAGGYRIPPPGNN